jgi:DNA-binding HxlR family transcriptional regulator
VMSRQQTKALIPTIQWLVMSLQQGERLRGFEMHDKEETISRILAVLSNPLRRAILLYLSEKGESSFTDLMNFLNIDTGKLSFHIRNLSGFIEQTPTGKYRLTKSGENAIRLVSDLETWAVEADVARSNVNLPFASIEKRDRKSVV